MTEQITWVFTQNCLERKLVESHLRYLTWYYGVINTPVPVTANSSNRKRVVLCIVMHETVSVP